MIGWGNAAVANGRLALESHFVERTAPRDAAFRRALEDELRATAEFLGL